MKDNPGFMIPGDDDLETGRKAPGFSQPSADDLDHRPEVPAPPSGSGRRRPPVWALFAMLLVAAGVLAALIINHNQKAETRVVCLLNDKAQVYVDDTLYCLETTNDRVRMDAGTGLTYAAGELIVSYTGPVDKQQAETDARSYGAELVGYIGSTGDCQWQFSGDPSLEQLEMMAAQVENQADVMAAEINCIMEEKTDDTGHFYDIAASPLNTEQENVMHLQEAREAFAREIEKRSSVNPVNVGLIDTYLVSKHEDLKFAGLFYNATNEELKDIVRDAASQKEKSNDQHGSHVAGIIGAVYKNGKGLDGAYPLAFDKKSGQSHLYGVSMNRSGEKADERKHNNSVFRMVQLEILFRNNVKVINYSMGANPGSDQEKKESQNRTARSLGAYLEKKYRSGTDFLIVASAGNDAMDCTYNSEYTVMAWTDYPDVVDRIMIVGNCTVKKKRYGTSNWGNRINLWAVGDDISSVGVNTLPDELIESGNNLFRLHNYTHMSGTSMSTPYVTGVAAMAWTLKPEWTGKELKDIMIEMSVELKPGSPEIDHVLNAAAIVNFAIGAYREEGPEIEDTPVTAYDVEGLLKAYYDNILYPEYGELPEKYSAAKTSLKKDDLDGLLYYQIYDYDQDGQSEMIVYRSEFQPSEQNKVDLLLEMYEVVDGTVVLQDIFQQESGVSMKLDQYPNIQAGLFRRNYNGKVYLIQGYDVYDREDTEHIYRAIGLSYNGRYLEIEKTCGFSQWPIDYSGENDTAVPEGLSFLSAFGLANTLTVGDRRIVNTIVLEENDAYRQINTFQNRYYEDFTILAKGGKAASGEGEVYPVAEIDINLSDSSETSHNDQVDVVVWRGGEKPASPEPAQPREESEEESKEPEKPSRTAAQALQEYLEENAPGWNIMPTYDMECDYTDGDYPQAVPGWSAGDLTGVLSADIRDYEADGQEELLVIRFETDSSGEMDLSLQMYEYDPTNDVVSLKTERSFGVECTMLDQNLFRAEQTNVFTYAYEGRQYIGIDYFSSMNDTITTLARYRYDGTNFVYDGAVSYEQYGEGDYVVRNARMEPDSVAGRETMWANLYDDSVWQPVYEWYIYDHDYEAIDPAELQEFKDIHRELVADLGLFAQEDIRSGFMEWTSEGQSTIPRQDVSALDVYSSQDGNITPLASIIDFYWYEEMPRYIVHRRDWTGSLDRWR